MIDLSAVNALLVSLSRSTDVLDISKNTYVPPSGGEGGAGATPGGARAPSAGMLADLEPTGPADAPSGAASAESPVSRMSRVAVVPLAAETEPTEPNAAPSQSLSGLRPPRTNGIASVRMPASGGDAAAEPSDGSTSARRAPVAAAPSNVFASSAAPAPADVTAPGNTRDTEASTSSNAMVGSARVGSDDAVAKRPSGGLSAEVPAASDFTADRNTLPPSDPPSADPTALHKPETPAASDLTSARNALPRSELPTADPATIHGAVSATEREALLRVRSLEQTLRNDRTGERDRLPSATAAALPLFDRPHAAAPMTAGDAQPVDGFAMQADFGTGQQLERAGVIASFILNAAMIPGWPPPRPFAVPGADELLGNLAHAVALPNDAEFLALLKRRGAKPALIARLRELLAKLGKSRRLRVILGLAALDAAIESVLESIGEELARLAHREEDGEPAELQDNWQRLSV